jgi:hypothetical protein
LAGLPLGMLVGMQPGMGLNFWYIIFTLLCTSALSPHPTAAKSSINAAAHKALILDLGNYFFPA